jgi:recX family
MGFKRAKHVDVPDRLLSYEEFTALWDHAVSSAIWQAENYLRSAGDILDRLYRKGYPNEPVEYYSKDKSDILSCDIADEVVNHLVEKKVIDEKEFASDKILSMIYSGKSVYYIRQKMRQKRFKDDIIEECINEHLENNPEYSFRSLTRQIEILTRSPSFTRLNPVKRKDRLIRSMSSKGFSVSDTLSWIGSHPEMFTSQDNNEEW